MQEHLEQIQFFLLLPPLVVGVVDQDQRQD
jgi:hypothetical protein